MVDRFRGGAPENGFRSAVEPAHRAVFGGGHDAHGDGFEQVFREGFLEGDLLVEQGVFEQRGDMIAQDGQIRQIARRVGQAGGAMAEEDPAEEAMLVRQRHNDFRAGGIERALQQLAVGRRDDMRQVDAADQVGVALQPAHKGVGRRERQIRGTFQAAQTGVQPVLRLIAQAGEDADARDACRDDDAFDDLIEQPLCVVKMARGARKPEERRHVRQRLTRGRLRGRTGGFGELLPQRTHLLLQVQHGDGAAQRGAQQRQVGGNRLHGQQAGFARRQEGIGVGQAESHGDGARVGRCVRQHGRGFDMAQVQQQDRRTGAFTPALQFRTGLHHAQFSNLGDRAESPHEIRIVRQQKTSGGQGHVSLLGCTGRATRKQAPRPGALSTSMQPE